MLLTASHALTFAQSRELPRPGGTSISGIVRYAAGGAPAEFVTVTLEANVGGIIRQTRTDRSGKFQFSNIGQEQFRVVVRHPGYREVQRSVDLKTAASEYVQIQLVSEKSDAVDPLSKIVNVNVPPEAQAEYDKGRQALMQEKNLKAGIVALEKAIKLAPTYTEAYLLLGAAYLDNKQLDKAESVLRKALELNPRAAAANFSLGEVYRRQQKYAEAEKVILEGLQLEPKSADGHLLLGQIYYAKGDVAKAGPEAGQAIQLKPDFAEAYLLAGNIFLKAQRPENSLQMFEEYLRLAPQGPFATQTREVVEKIKRALAEKKK